MTSKLHRSFPLVIFLSLVATTDPSTAFAQQPKLDIKLFAGAGATTYVSLLETGRERETFAGWQIGFGPRVRKRRWFVEALFSFNRWSLPRTSIEIEDEETGTIFAVSSRGRVNSFELPINGGFIPYQNAFFKLFLYAGYVNHFNTSIKTTVDVTDEMTGATEEQDFRLRPKEVDLAIYQAIARFGINVDLAMFNFDFNYSISLNSATSTSYRTGYHQLQLNVAYLF